MSYTPHTWVNDEDITAARLNAMENGIAAAGGGKYDAYDFVIKFDANTSTYTALKGTFSAISTALQNFELVHGFYEKIYVSGTWVSEWTSDLMEIGWNPSTNSIIIGIQCNGTSDSVEWSSSGIQYYD